MTSRHRNVATLADVGCTSYDLNIEMLGHRNMITLQRWNVATLKLSSPPISSSNLHTASKCLIFHLKCIKSRVSYIR